jgi:hypothetical protein
MAKKKNKNEGVFWNSGWNVEPVPDFGVAHQAFTKTNGCTTSKQSGCCVVFGDEVHILRIGGFDGVAIHTLFRSDTPTIVDTVISISISISSWISDFVT